MARLPARWERVPLRLMLPGRAPPSCRDSAGFAGRFPRGRGLSAGFGRAVLDAGVPGGYASWAVDSLLLLTDFVMDENSSAVSLLESLDPEAPILREEAAAILYHVLTGLGLLVY